MGSGSEFRDGPHILIVGLDQKTKLTLNQDGSNGEPYVTILSVTRAISGSPNQRMGRCARSSHRWPSDTIFFFRTSQGAQLITLLEKSA